MNERDPQPDHSSTRNERDRPGAAPPAKRNPSGGILLQFTLRGLPELDLYDDDAQARAALDRMGVEAGDLGRRDYWFGLAATVGTGILGMAGVRYFIIATRLPLPRWVADAVIGGATLLLVAIMLRHLHRNGAAAWLREDLLRGGVPVCLGCGYSLRGLPPAAGRCPECGRSFDERARRILETAGERRAE